MAAPSMFLRLVLLTGIVGIFVNLPMCNAYRCPSNPFLRIFCRDDDDYDDYGPGSTIYEPFGGYRPPISGRFIGEPGGFPYPIGGGSGRGSTIREPFPGIFGPRQPVTIVDKGVWGQRKRNRPPIPAFAGDLGTGLGGRTWDPTPRRRRKDCPYYWGPKLGCMTRPKPIGEIFGPYRPPISARDFIEYPFPDPPAPPKQQDGFIRCLKACLAAGRLHPTQCHSLC